MIIPRAGHCQGSFLHIFCIFTGVEAEEGGQAAQALPLQQGLLHLVQGGGEGGGGEEGQDKKKKEEEIGERR